jgi:hypothetical protein
MSSNTRFSFGFNWQRSISADEYPLLTSEKIKSLIAEELKSRSLSITPAANGIDFKMSAGKSSKIILPGGSRMPFLRTGNFSVEENNRTITVRCRNIILTGFFAVVTIIVFIQCYLFYWWNRDSFAPWTLVVPPALLILYFIYYAIFTRVALNSIWKKILGK